MALQNNQFDNIKFLQLEILIKFEKIFKISA